MFDRDFEKVEKSWNVSQRIMLDVPRRTHRHFIEPLSGTRHLVKAIGKRFLNFVNCIRENQKDIETVIRSLNNRMDSLREETGDLKELTMKILGNKKLTLMNTSSYVHITVL